MHVAFEGRLFHDIVEGCSDVHAFSVITSSIVHQMRLSLPRIGMHGTDSVSIDKIVVNRRVRHNDVLTSGTHGIFFGERQTVLNIQKYRAGQVRHVVEKSATTTLMAKVSNWGRHHNNMIVSLVSLPILIGNSKHFQPRVRCSLFSGFYKSDFSFRWIFAFIEISMETVFNLKNNFSK